MFSVINYIVNIASNDIASLYQLQGKITGGITLFKINNALII